MSVSTASPNRLSTSCSSAVSSSTLSLLVSVLYFEFGCRRHVRSAIFGKQRSSGVRWTSADNVAVLPSLASCASYSRLVKRVLHWRRSYSKRDMHFFLRLCVTFVCNNMLTSFASSLITGQTGLGKSTLINTIFASHLIDSKGRFASDEPVRKTTEIQAVSHGESFS